jgi:hypothetical protein
MKNSRAPIIASPFWSFVEWLGQKGWGMNVQFLLAGN